MSNFNYNYNSPSFSSVLLDSISRSIDSSPHPPIPPISDLNNHTKHTKRIKMRSASASSSVRNRTLTFDVDSWIQTHQSQPHQQIRIVRQQSVPTRSQYQPSDHDRRDTTATTCSFSSKIRINSPRFFAKTKSRAIELYGDFKTIKLKSKSKSPPVSPCKRIASFINSIFRNSGGELARKSKPPPSETSISTSTSSSSLVSKTTTWLEKSSTTSTETQLLATILHRTSPMNSDRTKEKRSEKEIDDELMMMMMIESDCDDDHHQDRAVSSSDYGDSDQTMNNDDGDDDEIDDDGGESCASSDLFELENLRFIGVSRYCEELPLYGTTSLHNITA